MKILTTWLKGLSVSLLQPQEVIRPAKPFGQELNTLQARAEKIQKICFFAAAFLCGSMVLALVCTTMAWIVEPDQELSSVLVPAHIMELFEPRETVAEVTSSPRGISGAAASTSQIVESMAGILDSTLFKVMSGISIFIGIVMGLVRLSAMPLIAAVIPAMLFQVLPALLGEISGPPKFAPQSAGEPFTEEKPNPLKTGEVWSSNDRLAAVLNSRAGVDDVSFSYILAQAEIKSGNKDAENVDRAAGHLRANDIKFEVPAKVAYAIEKASDGTVQTKDARRYHDKAVASAKTWRAVRGFIAGLGFTSLLVLAGVLAIYQIIKARLARLDSLIAQLN